MTARSSPITVKVAGPLALFTRPEMKVERVSYDVITPSAARGILESVLWRPQMRWVIRKLTVLRPIRFFGLKRNEVSSKVPSTVTKWARHGAPDRDYYADDDRQQRNALLLRDVAYLIEAVIELTGLAGQEDTIRKYVEMFQRRLEKGQCFQQPYLGCREFPATVTSPDDDERPDDELRGRTLDLGWMLHDIDYRDGRPRGSRFFQAVIEDGVIDIPETADEVAR
jgi:CRISPR-associated protein Cas5d